MDRRAFLRVLGLGAAAAVVAPEVLVEDPEKALWIPGARTFFLPPNPSVFHFSSAWDPERWEVDVEAGPAYETAEHYHRNTLLTPEMITREALAVFENQLSFIDRVNRQYGAAFAAETSLRAERVSDLAFAKGDVWPGSTINVRIPQRLAVLRG